MPSNFTWLSLLLLTNLMAGPKALAGLDPVSGIRVSVATTQQLIATLPLPSMVASEGYFSVHAAYMQASINGQNDLDAAEYGGKVSGGSAGLGYSTGASKNGFSLFASAMVNSLKGEASLLATDSGRHTFATTGESAVVGLSSRLIGGDNSPFVFGVFVGGAGMHFESELENASSRYFSKPFIFGPIAGAQLRLSLGKLVLKPYALVMKEACSECKKVTSPAGLVDLGEPCEGDASAAKIAASFYAVGLVLGYDWFSFNVYSKVHNDKALRDTSITNFALGYSF